MVLLLNITKIFAILLLLCATGAVLYLFNYFNSYQYQLCIPIRNCTYEWVESYEPFNWYYYNYVINNELTCEFVCQAKNISDCPLNGSICHFNQKIFDYCIRLGGDVYLLSCRSLWSVVGLPLFMWLLAVTFIILIMTIICTFKHDKMYNPNGENMPIFSNMYRKIFN